MKKEKYVVAVVGATGAVGNEMLNTLERRKFPISQLIPLASAKSAGKTLLFKKKKYEIKELKEDSFEGVDIALFSAGSSVSQKFAPIAAKAGAIVVDNTSAFRMDPEIPLVVPEVNAEDIRKHKGIIANPNCSTIQMLLPVNAINKKYKIKRLVVSTYQSVSGAGQKGINALLNESMQKLQGEKIQNKALGKQIAFNLIPQIDVFTENGFTKEELKMVNETKKILHEEDILVNATCVRVPVLRGHSESVNLELEKPFDLEELKKEIAKVDNLIIEDDPANGIYPMPINCEGRFETFVGRIRRDPTLPNGVNLWVVSDNLLKGAAFNAVQIAECLLQMDVI